MNKDKVRRMRHGAMKRAVCAGVLGAWMLGGGMAFAALSRRGLNPACEADCSSARQKCAEACREHAGQGTAVCLKACVQVERECRSDCQLSGSEDHDE